ncbi:MAG: AMIN domain-containing protein, partial [Deltaproteobacteria bacterium]|nr:AMIN domain-containing protein [Deltaproteobacteria bacterium]
MRIHWGLAIALGATFAWVNPAQAAGPKIDSVRIDGARDEAQVSIDGAFDNPKYAVRTREDGRLIIIDIEDAALPPGGINSTGSTSLIARTIASNTAHGARIELMLTGKATYRARATDSGISVKLHRGEGPNPPKARRSKASAGPKVEGIHLEQKDGRDRVVVELA